MTSLRMNARSAALLVALVPALWVTACDAKKNAAAGAAPSAGTSSTTGATGHANEEFCKTLVVQFDVMSKFDPSDTARRPAYLAEQRALNVKLLETAPASLKGDVQLQVKNANATYDAMATGNGAGIKATAAVNRSPENLAASKRMREYCGINPTVSH
jgi:hypothetical protein